MQDKFITVPETTLPNGTVVPSFQVGQYACTQGENGKASVQPDAAPWVRINYATARQACLNAGYALITELQWLAIAHDVAAQACNWTGGAVGEGDLFQGLRNYTVRSAQPGNVQPDNPDEQRWLTLSNGERICDMAGNVYQWVFDNVQGNDTGLIDSAFAEDSASLLAPFPSMQQGMGWRPSAGTDWSGDALFRGGYWLSGRVAGVFYLGDRWPDYEYAFVGFRCTNPGL